MAQRVGILAGVSLLSGQCSSGTVERKLGSNAYSEQSRNDVLGLGRVKLMVKLCPPKFRL